MHSQSNNIKQRKHLSPNPKRSLPKQDSIDLAHKKLKTPISKRRPVSRRGSNVSTTSDVIKSKIKVCESKKQAKVDDKNGTSSGKLGTRRASQRRETNASQHRISSDFMRPKYMLSHYETFANIKIKQRGDKRRRLGCNIL